MIFRSEPRSTLELSGRGSIRGTELSGSSSPAGLVITSPPCSTCPRESPLSRACWFLADAPPTARRQTRISASASFWQRTAWRLSVMTRLGKESGFRSWTPMANRPSARDRRPSTRWRGSGYYWLAARLRRTGSGMDSGPWITWPSDRRLTQPAWVARAIRAGER